MYHPNNSKYACDYFPSHHQWGVHQMRAMCCLRRNVLLPLSLLPPRKRQQTADRTEIALAARVKAVRQAASPPTHWRQAA